MQSEQAQPIVAALTAIFRLHSMLYSTHHDCALVACSVVGLQQG